METKLILTAVVLLVLCGCSVHFEVGYHGQTGRDDVMATKFIQAKNVEARKY